MHCMRKFLQFTILFLLLIHLESFGQISKKGIPPSFSDPSLTAEVPIFDLKLPEKPSNNQETPYDKSNLTPFEIGYTIQTNLSINNSGVWNELANGDKIWRLSVASEGAEAINVYFKDFFLPDRCELYIYNKDRTTILGAYTSDNNNEFGIFSTEILAGNIITIELLVPQKVNENAHFVIAEIGHIYRSANFLNSSLKNYGGSDPCEVNVNCIEGNNWQKQKRGVAKVVVKTGNSLSLCSGTLLNNTRRDFTPYFYTAEHCGPGATAADYLNWIFYFNYETPGCSNNVSEPNSNTLTGSQLLAKISYLEGSDFKLLLLKDEVPATYNPYFNGWNNVDQTSPSGVSIHHPEGDVKKISTYSQALVSTTYEGTTEDLTGSFWEVKWDETANGHGVTEGGSSGSPLFNAQGLVVGALTGGGATCSNLTAPDYYGKFANSWSKFATDNSTQLKPWLDPDNTGVTSISGLDYNDEYFIPEFKADTIIIPVGRPINFTDLSIGNITSWNWTFEGANQANSEIEHPTNVIYPNIGVYDVKLEISNNSQTEALTKTDYIKVVPLVTPVPADHEITVYLGTKPVSGAEITLIDESGREVMKFSSADAIISKVINVSNLRSGYYFLRIQTSEFVQTQKVVVI